MLIKQNQNKKAAFSLVETVIYVSLLAIISVIIINGVFSFTDSYRKLTVLRLLDHSAQTALERMTRDIRQAVSVDTSNSSLGVSPGVLSLNNPGSQTSKYYVSSGVLKMDENGTYYGPLTASTTTVTGLTFRFISGSVSSAVKIDMTISATDGQTTATKNYHSTVILRGQM
jgi:type II secretory pathway pseudopilin PulG